jgi:hypothetical protein
MATENAINTGYPIEASHGGTGTASPTAHTLPVAEGASAFTFLALTSGQLLIGSTGADPVAASLSAGTGISITPGAGTISIAATGGTGITWTVISADQNAAASNGYICNKASALVLTLPAVSAVGDTIEVTGINTALGWKIAQNAGNQIFFGSAATTAGAGGYLQSSAIHDAVRLVCTSTSANWQVVSSIGNITYV